MCSERSRTPMCYRDPEELMPGDACEVEEPDGVGGKVYVTRYRDGSSKVHFGGPVGPVRYDENGEEM